MELNDYEDDLKDIVSRVVKRNPSAIRKVMRTDPSESAFNNFDTRFDRINLPNRTNESVKDLKKDGGVALEISEPMISQVDQTIKQRTSVQAAFDCMANFDDILGAEFTEISDRDNVIDDCNEVPERMNRRSRSVEELLSTIKVDDSRYRFHLLDNFKQILNHESRHLVLLNTINSIQSILRESKVSVEALTNIFYNIADLIEAQNNLVSCLENIVSNWNVTENQFTDVMDLYVLLHIHCKEYVKNIITSTKELKVLFEKKEKFSEPLKVVNYEGITLRLEELLAKPTNWLCNSLENIKSLIEAAEGDFDMKRAKVILRKLRNCSEYRTQLSSDFIEKNKFLRSGLFVELLPNEQRKLRHVFLFSGMLVCANQILQNEGNANTTADSKNTLPELKHIERLDVRWYIPIENITIHQTKRVERCDKRELAIDNLKNKIRDLRAQPISERPRGSENFSFYKIGMKRDADKTHTQIMKAQADLLLLSPTIVFLVGNLSEKPRSLLTFSIKDLEIWKRDIIKSKTSLNATDVQMNNLANVNNFLDTYRKNDAVIESANLHSLHHTNENTISGVISTTIESVDGLNPVYSYYLSIEVDSFNINEVKALTKKHTNNRKLSWNETFDIDLECSHTMNIILYEVKNYAQEKESLLGYFEFKLDLKDLDNKSITKEAPNFREDGAFIQIEVSFKVKSRNDVMTRQPSMMKTSLFGISLNSVVDREKGKCSPLIENVPMIIQACLSRIDQVGIDEEGIYRICGSKNEISEFYKRLNKNVINALEDIAKYDLHTITSIVKLYLRELPEPLMLTVNYRRLLEISNNTEEDERYRLYSEVIEQMPEPNHSTVTYILKHFQRVCEHSNKNQMIASNLGLIIGPTLMMPPCNNDKKDTTIFAIETISSLYLSKVLTQILNGVCTGSVLLSR